MIPYTGHATFSAQYLPLTARTSNASALRGELHRLSTHRLTTQRLVHLDFALHVETKGISVARVLHDDSNVLQCTGLPSKVTNGGGWRSLNTGRDSKRDVVVVLDGNKRGIVESEEQRGTNRPEEL